MMENCWRFRTATNAAEAGIDDLNDVETIMKTIRATDYGHISLFDFQNGLMRLYCRREFDTPYDFSLSPLQSKSRKKRGTGEKEKGEVEYN